jgi:hypothetical protein
MDKKELRLSHRMMAQPIFMEDGHTKKIFTTHEQLQ